MFTSRKRHPNVDPMFDLCEAITEYLTDNGVTCEVTVDFDRNDPDYPTYDLTVDWYEDGDNQSFVVRNCQNLTPETLFDLWVREREKLHTSYLEWLDENAEHSRVGIDFSPANPWDAPGMSVSDFIR